jgi:hypothetical protein
MQQPVPFRPDPLARQAARADSIYRGITALACARSLREAGAVAKQRWPDDRVAADIATRAAVTPTSTTTANVPISNVISDLIALLGPKSGAAAELFSRALQLEFNTAASIMVPNVTPSVTGVTFIAQGSPFPVRQLAFSAGPVIAPQKMVLGAGLTREMTESSNGEKMIEAVLRENIALALDTLLLDTVQGTTTRPQGLRYNVNALSATAGGGVGALIADLAQLVDAVSAIGTDVMFLANPREAIKVRAHLPLLGSPVIATSGLATGVLMSVVPRALAVIGSDQPIRVETSTETAVHYEDTSPQPISTVGTPNQIAAPVLSAFQMDHTVIKLVADITWSMRTTGAVAWTSSVSW